MSFDFYLVGNEGFFFLRFTPKNALHQKAKFNWLLPDSFVVRVATVSNPPITSIFFKTPFFSEEGFSKYMVGVVGFEPTDGGFRVPCLTTWRHSSVIGWDCMERVWFCKFIFLMIDNVSCRYQESLFWVSVIL